jgi:UDP-3-O-[3-hydroxymyristoyl] N-acetylglucosamine deacetylase
MELQTSIRKPVRCEGVGLHTGVSISMVLSPAPPDHGIVFVVGPERVAVPVLPESLLNGHYATTIGAEGIQIQTVEHLLAAVRGLGIDNLLIELDGPELPAMDGSSAPFVSLLYAAGRETQIAVRPQPLRVAEAIRVGDEHRWLQLLPAPDFRISYTLDHEHPAVGVQVASFVPTERVFVEELAPARTYGFLKDLELLRQQGLALGGSLANAVVVGQERILTAPCGSRTSSCAQDPRRSGTWTLVGRPCCQRRGRNAGHALNHLPSRVVKSRAAVGRRASRRSPVHVEAPSEGATAAPPRRHPLKRASPLPVLAAVTARRPSGARAIMISYVHAALADRGSWRSGWAPACVERRRAPWRRFGSRTWSSRIRTARSWLPSSCWAPCPRASWRDWGRGSRRPCASSSSSGSTTPGGWIAGSWPSSWSARSSTTS